MIPVAVIDELLFLALTAIDRGPEVPDFGGLTCRAERAEGRVHVTGLLPYRTVIDPIDQLHGISSRKWCADRVAWFVKNKHAECCEQVVEEAYAGIVSAGSSALADHHIPVGSLMVRDRFPHRAERSLLVPEPDGLVGTKQMLVDLLCQFLPVFRCEFLDLIPEIPFHLLDISRGMTEHENGNLCPKFAARIRDLKIATFLYNLFNAMFIHLAMIVKAKGEP
jgi:hypothetical protein